jgi:hypothetical protein
MTSTYCVSLVRICRKKLPPFGSVSANDKVSISPFCERTISETVVPGRVLAVSIRPSIGFEIFGPDISIADTLSPSELNPVRRCVTSAGEGGSSALISTSLNAIGKIIENEPPVGTASPGATADLCKIGSACAAMAESKVQTIAAARRARVTTYPFWRVHHPLRGDGTSACKALIVPTSATYLTGN